MNRDKNGRFKALPADGPEEVTGANSQEENIMQKPFIRVQLRLLYAFIILWWLVWLISPGKYFQFLRVPESCRDECDPCGVVPLFRKYKCSKCSSCLLTNINS